MVLSRGFVEKVYSCCKKSRKPRLGNFDGFYLHKETGRLFRVKLDKKMRVTDIERCPIDKLSDVEVEVCVQPKEFVY